MSARKVLDSYALIAFLEDEPGADKVGELIKKARDQEKPLLMSVINWGEIYYILYRAAGRAAAAGVIQSIETLPIEIVDVNKEITLIAAEYKSSRRMSYADCFAAALAKFEKAELVTGDKEFKEVEKIIKILWL